MTIEEILQRHIEIQEKATEGPWEYTPAGDDEQFIAESRTAWPATTRALQEALVILAMIEKDNHFKEGDYGYQFKILAETTIERIQAIMEGK